MLVKKIRYELTRLEFYTTLLLIKGVIREVEMAETNGTQSGLDENDTVQYHQLLSKSSLTCLCNELHRFCEALQRHHRLFGNYPGVWTLDCFG